MSCCLPLESCFRVITLSEDLIGGLGKGRMGMPSGADLSACVNGDSKIGPSLVLQFPSQRIMSKGVVLIA